MVGHQARKAVPCTSVQQSHVLDKTKMCQFFAKGQCTRGRLCTFAHTEEQLHPQPDLFRTELCYTFARTGKCWAGDGCKFAHRTEEVRPVSALIGTVAVKAKLTPEGKASRRRRAPAGGAARPRSSQAEEVLGSGDAGLLYAASKETQSPFSCHSTEVDSFSRQTTPGWSSPWSSGQSSAEFCGRCGDEDEAARCPRCIAEEEDAAGSESERSAEGISEEGLRIGAEAGLTLFLHNTFIDAEPAELESPPAQRRAKSLPAGRSHGH